jgi:hypothetical protein
MSALLILAPFFGPLHPDLEYNGVHKRVGWLKPGKGGHPFAR